MKDDRTKAIAIRAFEIWEAEGRRHGFGEIYWLRAEKELGFAPDAAMQGDKPQSADRGQPGNGTEPLKAGLE
jgi:hypothetical protein